MLELKNISLIAEDDGKQILNNVSFTVETGSFTAITGPNGGGKSSLAKVISGVLTPTSGKVIYNGQDITPLSITERANAGISFAFQQPVRFKGLSVLDLLSLAAGRTLTMQEGCEFLSAVGLQGTSYVNREVNASLSGGEMKRVEIAMSIARATPLSLFDEPEAGIDLWSFQNLIEVFKGIRQKSAGTVVIISHQERILEIADRIVVLADGKVSAMGTKDEILPALLNGTEPCLGCDVANCPQNPDTKLN